MICRIILRVVGLFFVDWLEAANFWEGYDAETKEAI